MNRAAFIVGAFMAALFSVAHAAGGNGGVSHGSQIGAGRVGPKAADYNSLRPSAGGEIKQRQDYAFGRFIGEEASYDGVVVPAGHLLIEAIAFSSPLDISAPFPVVLRGISVRVPGGSPWAILMRPTSGGLYIFDSDAGGASARAVKPVHVALDVRGGPVVVRRSHFSRALDGIHVSGNDTVIEASLIDDLAAAPGSHNDAIQLLGTPRHVRVTASKIINSHPQTSCLYLLGEDITVQANYIAGGGWSVYAGANNNGHGGAPGGPVRLLDNVFGRDHFAKGGHFGPVAYWDRARALDGDWRDNRFDDGTAIKP